MRYLRIAWIHDDPDEPVELYTELDGESWEVRKVERFRDGSVGLADSSGHTEDTRLGLEPVPSLDEIARNPEFRATEISERDFESVWQASLASVSRTVEFRPEF